MISDSIVCKCCKMSSPTKCVQCTGTSTLKRFVLLGVRFFSKANIKNKYIKQDDISHRPIARRHSNIAMANVKVQCAQWCGQKWSTRVLLAGFVCREVLNEYYETIWNRILGNSSKMFVFFSLFDFASLLLTLVVSIDFHKVSVRTVVYLVWGIGILCFKWRVRHVAGRQR